MYNAIELRALTLYNAIELRAFHNKIKKLAVLLMYLLQQSLL